MSNINRLVYESLSHSSDGPIEKLLKKMDVIQYGWFNARLSEC